MNKKITLLLLLFICTIFSNAQVGINTNNPKTTLDVNGDIRIRNVVKAVTDSNSKYLVVDGNGVLKEMITGRETILEAELQSDFSSGSTNSKKFKITNWKILQNPYSDFSLSESIFTVPVNGIYSITMSYSLRRLSDVRDNYVLGLANKSDDKWILRFSQERPNLTRETATASSITFTGVVELKQGQECFFGITQDVGIVAKQNNANVSFIRIRLIETK